MSIYNSTFTNNTSTNGDGGALRNRVTTGESDPAVVSFNTFTGNTAQGMNGMGGAIVNESGALAIDHSTFADNQVTASAGRGGAMFGVATHEVPIPHSSSRVRLACCL